MLVEINKMIISLCHNALYSNDQQQSQYVFYGFHQLCVKR